MKKLIRHPRSGRHERPFMVRPDHIGGASQLLAILGFVMLLLGTVWWGKKLGYQPVAKIFEPPGPSQEVHRTEVSRDQREQPLLLRSPARRP